MHFQCSGSVFREIGSEFIGGKTRRRSYRGLRICAHASAWEKPFNSVINSSRSSVVIARISHCFFWGVEPEAFVVQFLPTCPFSWHLKQRPSSLCLLSSSSERRPIRTWWLRFRSTSIGTSSRPPDFFLGASLPFLVSSDL